jgi:hypothetical protein
VTAAEFAIDFASRPAEPKDHAFIVDSFFRSYLASGHVAGIRDRFSALVGQPFRACLRNVEDKPDALLAARVVYPVEEPTEIAGYAVWSPRHRCLLYILRKPAYAGCGVTASLLRTMPTTVSTEARDQRPYLIHSFSTAAFSRVCGQLGIRTRYSPFLFLRILDELTEDPTT